MSVESRNTPPSGKGDAPLARARGPRCVALLALLALLVFSLGCRCGEDRPYTPFGVTSALPQPLPSASVPESTAPTPSGSAARAVEKAVLAPANSKRWALEGRELAAPQELVFESAVHADFDRDGVAETAAWLVARAEDGGTRVAGELWLYPASGEPRRVAGLPGFVPTGPNCKLVTALTRSGPQTLTLDARAECTGALIARSPVRALLVLAPAAERPEVLLLRVAAPAPGETLELSTITEDRDGDGRDDVALTVAVAHGNAPRVAAPLVWLDRAVGPARETSEPRVSFERLALHQAARAKTKKHAEDVVRGVASIRRLMSTLCAEGATARLFDRDGAPLGCGALAASVDALANAEITAELARGRVSEAFGALARDGWYFGRMSANLRKRLERAVLDAVEPLPAEVTRLDARAVTPPGPRYSPLAFAADGTLAVLTASGITRFGASGPTLEPMPAGGSPRSLAVSPAAGQHWQGVAYSCDRSETALLFDTGAPFVTQLLSPRPGACGRAAFEALPAPAPLSAENGRIAAIVGGSLVGDAAGAPAGSARSPDGRWTVVPTPFGLLVDGPSHRLLSLGNAIARPLALTDCVASNDGRAAACLDKSEVVLAKAGGL